MSGFVITKNCIVSISEMAAVRPCHNNSVIVILKNGATFSVPEDELVSIGDQLREKETIDQLKKRIALLEAQLLYMPGGAAQVGLGEHFKELSK